MTTQTFDQAGSPSPATIDHPASHADRIRPVTALTVLGVELRKLFDTRSGMWMMVGILLLAAAATGAVILWAPEEAQTYETFGTAVGMPMSVILPMIAILSVTSEWSQRSGLTTFTLVPRRSRVIGAKFVAVLIVGVLGMLAALGVGALGNLLAGAVGGFDPVWGLTLSDAGFLILANTLGVVLGFALGVLIRNSPAAIVIYFVYMLVLPTVTGLLAMFQSWFADLQPWVDFQYNQIMLYDRVPDAEQWLQLAAVCGLWLVLPIAFGVWRITRSEVK